ncbi:MAG: hypothetical protein ABH850_02190 [Candidatus Micrarchaeota archaeon]
MTRARKTIKKPPNTNYKEDNKSGQHTPPTATKSIYSSLDLSLIEWLTLIWRKRLSLL